MQIKKKSDLDLVRDFRKGDQLAFEELLSRYDGIEITGPIERVQSTFVGGLKHLPVKLKARKETQRVA